MAEPKGFIIVPVAYRSDGSLHALELDNSDRLKVLIDSVTGQILVAGQDSGAVTRILRTDSSGHLLVDGADNTFLQPLASYNRYENLTLAAGLNTLTAFTVPAGQRLILDHATFRYVGTVAGVVLRLFINDGTNNLVIRQISPPVSDVYYEVSPGLVLEAGYTVGIIIVNATLNDDTTVITFCRRIR